ncbi:3-oxoadipate enol-lactonase [Phytoactinopolyspora halotolerans]|uniref:3-oxoadipate enol-lactonase n=1 Tax=Phytoactinopolyspora halotolerans TaxID=1981512 RepID=A0A6L9SCY4_9ACTN|nr:3-oxoadipate enol-lactonase [Phytoactinopolyspora halotolerans]NEE02937.1 3-oxoadipate enol-lactonase [Phytoactinopolyspora halotolerans]
MVDDHGVGRRERHRLGYDIHGPADAPVVVLGSSLGTTRAMWDPQLDALSASFRVIRYDHLGHGASEVPPGPYSIEGLAADLIGLLDELGVRRAHLGGLSLGGMVALQAAAAFPERVDRLAVICSSAHLPPADGWRERAATVRDGGMAAVADRVVARWFTSAFAETAAAKALYDDLLRTPAEGYAGCCEAIAAMDLRPVLSQVRSPTLVVAGEQDPATPIEHARTVADGVAQGGAPVRVETVRPAAHLGSVERPEEVSGLLLDHLRTSAGESA